MNRLVAILVFLVAVYSPSLLLATKTIPSGQGETPPQGKALDRAKVAIDEELTQAGNHLKRLADFEASLQNEQKAVDQENENDLTLIAGLGAELTKITRGSTAVMDLYQQVAAVVKKEREQVRQLLNAWDGPLGVPVFSQKLLLETLDIPSLEGPLNELKEAIARIAREEARLQLLARSQRRERILMANELLQRARMLQIEVVRKGQHGGWSELVHDAQQGFPLTRESFKLVGVNLQFLFWQRSEELKEFLRSLGDVITLGGVLWGLLKILIVILVLRFLLDRFQTSLRKKRATVHRKRWQAGAMPRRNFNLFSLAEAVAPWTFFLIGLRIVLGILNTIPAWPSFIYLHQSVYLYGFYRLAIDVLVEVVVVGGRLFRLRFSSQEKATILVSVRTLMRAFFLCFAALGLAEFFVGTGLLYDLGRAISLFISLGVIFWVFRGWSLPLVNTYLKIFPTGTFPDWVRKNPQGWRASLFSPLLFLILVLMSILFSLQEAADRFESSRKLVTFVSRKRIEMKAGKRGWAEGDLADLPVSLVEAFTTAEAPFQLLVDNFPGKDKLTEAFEAWQSGSMKGAFLLVGDKGIGKRCWLRTLPHSDFETNRIILHERIVEVSDLTALLASVLWPERQEPASLEEIREVLLATEARVIEMQFCHHLFLSAVDGYKVIDAFFELVEDTSSRVFWLCSMNLSAWNHLEAVRNRLSPFRWVQVLDGWSPQDIQSLISKRVEASGVRFDYQDLRLGGGPGKALFITSAELIAEDYAMLLWDYTNGNPHLALHFFLRSLTPNDVQGVVKVRLFKPPDGEDLSAKDKVAPLLAALVVHGTLTLREAEVVSRYPPADCLIYFNWLLDLGLAARKNERYYITSYWYPAVRQYLKRKNLLNE